MMFFEGTSSSAQVRHIKQLDSRRIIRQARVVSSETTLDQSACSKIKTHHLQTVWPQQESLSIMSLPPLAAPPLLLDLLKREAGAALSKHKTILMYRLINLNHPPRHLS